VTNITKSWCDNFLVFEAKRFNRCFRGGQFGLAFGRIVDLFNYCGRAIKTDQIGITANAFFSRIQLQAVLVVFFFFLNRQRRFSCRHISAATFKVAPQPMLPFELTFLDMPEPWVI